MIKLHICKKLALAEGEQMLTLDAELSANSFTALYGPSGAGKTTILQIIAGLVQPEEGIIEVNGETWLNTHRKINLPAQRRNIGYMFQDYALFPNMTVKQNLLFAASDKRNLKQLRDLLSLMQLENLADTKPSRLSGGQQQRVALARAIIKQPRVLLLDEPLSAIGSEMRIYLRQQLAALHQHYHFTTLMVSHDAGEVYQLADRVLQIERGRLITNGTPNDLFKLSEQNKLQLLAEVLSVDASGVKVLVNGQIITISTALINNQLVQPGDKVSLLCNSADLTIQKLS